jgi:hypothetical protein
MSNHTGNQAGESAADWRKRWLGVIGYEIKMLCALAKIKGRVIRFEVFPPVGQGDVGMIPNAIPESMVLHARNLCDFCMPRQHSTDLKPENLFDDYYSNTRYDTLQKLAKDVHDAYAKKILSVVLPNGNTESWTPQWAFNKMLAHPTQDRGFGFDYASFLDLVVPKIKLLADEIGRLEKEQGRDFPSLP